MNPDLPTLKCKVGSTIKFEGDIRKYTVQAVNQHFLIATRPVKLRDATLALSYCYTIVDFAQNVRGAVNLPYGLDQEIDNPKDAAILLGRLSKTPFKIGVSSHNRVPLLKSELAQMVEQERYLPVGEGKPK